MELDFDGYGIGGLSVGETREEMVPALAAALAQLPDDRPRYLMGVGDPASLVEAVALGVDQFDCVMQTRIGRHGTAMTGDGKLHIKNAKHALSDEPLDSDCACEVCQPPQPRLHPSPVPGRRTDGSQAGQHPQHQLDAAAHGSDAGGDRSRNVRRVSSRRSGCLAVNAQRVVLVASIPRRLSSGPSPPS